MQGGKELAEHGEGSWKTHSWEGLMETHWIGFAQAEALREVCSLCCVE